MIIGVLAAWVVIAVLLVGLPLAAWWVGGRAVWNRPARRGAPDVFRDMVRRHGLRPAETAQVEAAVTWGRELQEPRLRAAVVDWAETLQRTADEQRGRHPGARRVGRALLFVWFVVAAAALAFAVAQGEWSRVLNMLLWPVLFAYPTARLAGAPRRAIRLNSDPVSR